MQDAILIPRNSSIDLVLLDITIVNIYYCHCYIQIQVNLNIFKNCATASIMCPDDQ